MFSHVASFLSPHVRLVVCLNQDQSRRLEQGIAALEEQPFDVEDFMRQTRQWGGYG